MYKNKIFSLICSVFIPFLMISTGSADQGIKNQNKSKSTNQSVNILSLHKNTVNDSAMQSKQRNITEISKSLAENGKVKVIIQIAVSSGINDPADTVVQRVKRFLSSPELLYHINSDGLSVTSRYDFIPFFAATVDANGLEMLRSHPDVISIEPDAVSKLYLSESVPKVIGQNNPWTIKYDGNNTWIAVLDSGVDINHEMFAGKKIIEACFTTDGSCPNGKNRQLGRGSSVPIDPHGTHVAGIAVGNYIPARRLGGVAHNANLISIRVFNRDKQAYRSSILAGLNYTYSLAATRYVAAANLSFGEKEHYSYHSRQCDYSNQSITAAMRALRLRRVAPVVAAEGTTFHVGQGEPGIDAMSFPACISHAISVINAQKDYSFDHLTMGASTYFVSMAAPGTKIYSAIPGNRYGVMTGASMAAPHVSGLFAILREYRPRATVAAIQNALDNSGRNIKLGNVINVMWPIGKNAVDNIGGHRDRVSIGFNTTSALKRMQDYSVGQWQINPGTFHGGNGVAYSHGELDFHDDAYGYSIGPSLTLPRTHVNGAIAVKLRRISVSDAVFGDNCLDVKTDGVRVYWGSDPFGGYSLCYQDSGTAYVRGANCPSKAFAAIKPFNWNTLLVTTGGKHIKFYINGSLFCQHEDKSKIYGRPGVTFFNSLAYSTYLVDWFYTKVSGINELYHEL